MRRFDRIVFDSHQSDAKKAADTQPEHTFYFSRFYGALRGSTQAISLQLRDGFCICRDRAALRPIVYTTLNYRIKIARARTRESVNVRR